MPGGERKLRWGLLAGSTTLIAACAVIADLGGSDPIEEEDAKAPESDTGKTSTSSSSSSGAPDTGIDTGPPPTPCDGGEGQCVEPEKFCGSSATCVKSCFSPPIPCTTTEDCCFGNVCGPKPPDGGRSLCEKQP